MTYYLVSTKQMIMNSFMIALLAAGLVEVNRIYHERRNMPEVHISGNNMCVKVINYLNGDAFNCNDVDVVLRRYRKVYTQ